MKLAWVDAPHQLRPRSWLGQRFPLHASAGGKVLLASYCGERLVRFLLEPLARFTPSTITNAEALRAELEGIRELGYAGRHDPDQHDGSRDHDATLSSACRADPDHPLIRQPDEEHGSTAQTAQFRCG